MKNNDAFKVLVTVKIKKGVYKSFPIWNKLLLTLCGDKSDLINLQKQLKSVKGDVKKDMNRKGYALRDVNINIEFLD